MEPSNLNRQILYGAGDIGKNKVERAKEVLDAFSLGTEVVTRMERITADTAIPADAQIVLCALDNFESRFALEQTAARHHLPLVDLRDYTMNVVTL